MCLADFMLSLTEAHPRAPAVFIDEFQARLF